MEVFFLLDGQGLLFDYVGVDVVGVFVGFVLVGVELEVGVFEGLVLGVGVDVIEDYFVGIGEQYCVVVVGKLLVEVVYFVIGDFQYLLQVFVVFEYVCVFQYYWCYWLVGIEMVLFQVVQLGVGDGWIGCRVVWWDFVLGDGQYLLCVVVYGIGRYCYGFL